MASSPLLHVVLHEPEIPYNTGSVGRTCVALGAKLWLVRPLGFQLEDRQLKRAGLDYWAHLDWEVVDSWAHLCERIPTDRLWLLSKKAERSYLTAEFESGDAIVFGSESAGLPATIRDQTPDRCLRIPIRPEVRSLNLSVSVAITGFEFARRLGGLADL